MGIINLGLELKKLRVRKGLTQKELGQILDYEGPQAISTIEKGRAWLPFEKLYDYARAVDVEPYQLLRIVLRERIENENHQKAFGIDEGSKLIAIKGADKENDDSDIIVFSRYKEAKMMLCNRGKVSEEEFVRIVVGLLTGLLARYVPLVVNSEGLQKIIQDTKERIYVFASSTDQLEEICNKPLAEFLKMRPRRSFSLLSILPDTNENFKGAKRIMEKVDNLLKHKKIGMELRLVSSGIIPWLCSFILLDPNLSEGVGYYHFSEKLGSDNYYKIASDEMAYHKGKFEELWKAGRLRKVIQAV